MFFVSLWGFDLRRRLCWRKIKLKRFRDSRAWRRKRLDFSCSNTLQMNLRLEFISLRADELMTTRWVWPLAEQQVWMMQGGGCSRDTFSAALLFFSRENQNWQRRLSSEENMLRVLFLTGFQFSSTSRLSLTCIWHKTSGCHQLLAKKSDWSFSNYCSRQSPLARNQIDTKDKSSGCGQHSSWLVRLPRDRWAIFNPDGRFLDHVWGKHQSKALHQNHWLYIQMDRVIVVFMLSVSSYLLSFAYSK